MKIKDLLEAAPEWIKHPSSKGVMIKNPRWEPSLKTPREPASGMNRSQAMKARHAAHKAKLDKLYHFIWMEVGNSFPDGDPSYEVAMKARRMFGLDEWADPWKYINAAIKLHEPFNSLSEWLASMWDETAADRMYDAKNGHPEENSLFYTVGDNGEIEPEGNPWK